MPPHDALMPAGRLPEERELQRWNRWTLGVALACALALFAWALWAPLHSAVVSRGLLRVEDYRQLIQHQEGGLVKAIRVHNGDSVRKGQPLIELEDTRVNAAYDILQQQQDAEQARLARLSAERDFLASVSFTPALLQRRDDPAIAALLRSELSLFDQRRQTLTLQLNILQRQIAEVEREVAAGREQVAADLSAQEAMHAEVKQNAALQDKGFISPARMHTMNRGLNDYQSRLAEHRADLSRALQKQDELRLKVEETRNAYRQAAVAELKEATLRANDLAQQLRPAEDARQRQVILAPTDGVVMNLRVHTLGAAIAPREALMEIVPPANSLLVEVKLPQTSVSDIKPGMAAEVRLLAFDARNTPLVDGTLVYLSADALSEANGEIYYQGQIRLDATSLAQAGLGPLQPGMPAEVYVRTRERNAIDYFIDPIRLSLARAFKER